jgi:hypothetical protein
MLLGLACGVFNILLTELSETKIFYIKIKIRELFNFGA